MTKISVQAVAIGSLAWFPEELPLFGRGSNIYRGECLQPCINPIKTEVICISKKSIIVRTISKTMFCRLALNTMTLQVTSVNVNSGQGVAISVTGIAQVIIVLVAFNLLTFVLR